MAVGQSPAYDFSVSDEQKDVFLVSVRTVLSAIHMQVTDRLLKDAPSLTQAIIAQMVYLEIFMEGKKECTSLTWHPQQHPASVGKRKFKLNFALLKLPKETEKCARSDNVKSQIFVRYLVSYFRTFEKSAKFNAGWKYVFVWRPLNLNVILFWGPRKYENLFERTSLFKYINFSAKQEKEENKRDASSRKYENGYRTKMCNF